MKLDKKSLDTTDINSIWDESKKTDNFIKDNLNRMHHTRSYTEVVEEIKLLQDEKYVFIKRTELLKKKLADLYPNQTENLEKYIDDKFIDQKHLEFIGKSHLMLYNPK